MNLNECHAGLLCGKDKKSSNILGQAKYIELS